MTTKVRQQRKDEHLSLALSIDPGPKSTGFDDIELIHQAISNLGINNIDTTVEFMGKQLQAPLLIEAITGGTKRGMAINKCFAEAAGKTGIAMAVGSQTVAIEDQSTLDTFAIVREYNPKGVILANVGAGVSADKVFKAVEMIKADGIQLHLNMMQELIMDEGDRCFKNTNKNIKEILSTSPVPVIIKEVGFGMSRETALSLYGLGVKIIDVGGSGGTNFATIENSRRTKPLSPDWYHWGISTAASLLECLDAKVPVDVIASGGIDNGIKAAKALALGATLVGAARPFLQAIASNYDTNNIIALIKSWTLELKMSMLLTGAYNLAQLRQKPLVISGLTKEWAEMRGIDLLYGLK